VPAVLAALRVSDGPKAAAALDRVRSQVTGLFGSRQNMPPFNEVSLADGVRGWEARIDDRASIVYGVDDDLALIGSSVEVLRRFQKPSSRLTDEPAYREATDQMPGRVQGLLWLNMEAVLKLGESTNAFDESDEDVVANLRPVKNVAAWSTGGEQPTFEVFFTVR